MSESEFTQRDIGAIRTRLDQIEAMQRMVVAMQLAQMEGGYSRAEVIKLVARTGASNEAIGAMLGISAKIVGQRRGQYRGVKL